MAYPVAAGTESMSGKYIPEIWSSNLLVKFYENTCLAKISNTEYEGQIQKAGDKVHIQMYPDLTINNYVKGQNLKYEEVTTEEVTLDIDKGKYWAFPANDVDKKQSNIEFVGKWSEDASTTLKQEVETDVFAAVYADAATYNKGATAGYKSRDINLGVSGTPLAITKDNVLEVLVDIGVCMDEYKVPEGERSIVIPAWMAGLIKKSDLKDASLTGDGSSVLRTGRLGMIDRLTLYTSNLLASGADGAVTAYNVIACQKKALTFAAQITENEKVRNPNDFGDLIRGLMVFGYKVVKPEAMVHLYCYKG
jgi:hypothetical protein